MNESETNPVKPLIAKHPFYVLTLVVSFILSLLLGGLLPAVGTLLVAVALPAASHIAVVLAISSALWLYMRTSRINSLISLAIVSCLTWTYSLAFFLMATLAVLGHVVLPQFLSQNELGLACTAGVMAFAVYAIEAMREVVKGAFCPASQTLSEGDKPMI